MFSKRGVKTRTFRRPEESAGEPEAVVWTQGAHAIKKARIVTATTTEKAAASNKDEEVAISGYQASAAQQERSDQKATSALETETEASLDSRAILERNLEIGKAIQEGQLERGEYRGLNAYAKAINTSKDAIAAGKYTGLKGPVRSQANIRISCRFDYQPDICKDWKETGYCGFGDSCKFLHDRSDYKSGWQLEKEWEEAQQMKMRKNREKMRSYRHGGSGKPDGHSNEREQVIGLEADADSDSSDEGDGLPFACLECRKRWTLEMKPVVTKCGHYFCENCALESFIRNPKCCACNENTDGIFNNATKIISKITESL
eukprot:Filipodium_phascolosomae@DN2165_c0_g1_i5.p1